MYGYIYIYIERERESVLLYIYIHIYIYIYIYIYRKREMYALMFVYLYRPHIDIRIESICIYINNWTNIYIYVYIYIYMYISVHHFVVSFLILCAVASAIVWALKIGLSLLWVNCVSVARMLCRVRDNMIFAGEGSRPTQRLARPSWEYRICRGASRRSSIPVPNTRKIVQLTKKLTAP